ncbi:major capsid protein [macacine betaherpesvirus 9]|uniref:Major capsid protein n=1 Tax=macacine betaherpesvirus 9 TaxID=2560568 RepID=A0A191S3R0_9BETA|nr:major capsid protein [macacine betaherpesvirus 9]ANC96515.1 major capsid protein [macacine betaherpesvirus 9]
MENWHAAEILPKIHVSSNTFDDIRTQTAEQLFENLRLYYGDDPNRYNLSFEAILGIYCNRTEWIDFFHTSVAVAAHVIRFNDLEKMSLGKILFFIQLPRVATGNDATAPKETTVIVTKYSEKYPITISFELSSACLSHLENTFKNTILNQMLNINAIHTVLRSLKNSADSLQRGLIYAFIKTLLKKSPPQFLLKTMLENKVHSKQMLTKVQRSNMFQSFKNKLINSLFFLNRTENSGFIYRFLCEMVESATEGILNNVNHYILKDGTSVNGVLLGTSNTIQSLNNVLTQFTSQVTVSAPASYGTFVMGKENAVTAIAYQAIMADFANYTKNIATEQQDQNTKSDFFENNINFADIKVNIIKLSDKVVVLDHLKKVYKNTNIEDPLEQKLELTFFFPLGLYIPVENGFSTMDNKIKLNNTMENNLPTNIYFYNKDNIMQKIDFSDLLPSLCHPIIFDSSISERIFASATKPTGHIFNRLCQIEFIRETPNNILSNLYYLYEIKKEVPKSSNMLKNELTIDDFYKSENFTIQTELHPFFDFSYMQKDRATEILCCPRIMLGNIPLPLTPPSFHEARAHQMMEHAKTNNIQYDATIKLISDSFSSTSYPELAYIIETLVHGNKTAFQILKSVISECITYWFNVKHLLLFCANFEMVYLITTFLGDELIPGSAYAHYKNIISILKLVKRTVSISNFNDQLCGEPLVGFVNALFDNRLFCPFLNTMPKNEANAIIVSNDIPLSQNTVKMRNYEISDLNRMNLIDSTDVFTDLEKPSFENTVLSKIFYFCFLPALANNKICGGGVDIKNFVLDFFYTEPFILPDDNFYEQPITHEVLLDIIREAVGYSHTAAHLSCIAKQLFKSLLYISENTKILEIESYLDPSQRHGKCSDFKSLQHVLYNGLCLTSPINILKKYFKPIPFHRYFSDPIICGLMNIDIQAYLNVYPHYQRNDGGFPLPIPLAHEFHNWQRTPFFIYASSCSNSLLSIMTLASMHCKLSPIAIILLSKQKIHPGFAATLVRTDCFDVNCLLYSSKSATSIMIDDPIVSTDVKDIGTTYNLTQHISFLDMGIGFSSNTAIANLKRVKTDMGSKIQDLFAVFPMHSFNNSSINSWVRHHIGIEKPNLSETDILNMLSFGKINQTPQSILLHGQQAICEVIICPVTADLNFFKTPKNPRGRNSCMMSIDPHNELEAMRSLYDHSLSDSDSFLTTINPWASQKGSLSDVLYNTNHRNQLGYNPKSYSPNAIFFTDSEILKTNKFMFKLITDYSQKTKTCLDSDSDIQYCCSEGTDELIHRPCHFLQSAFPIHCSSNQALLESRSKNGTTFLSETHFSNFAIGEAFPLQNIIESLL